MGQAYLMPDLEPLVEAAYRRFRRAAPPDLGVCTVCCMDPEVERRMLAKSPRDLTRDEMREWFSAATAAGAGSGWILPRVLDGLARDEEMAATGVEVTLRRFQAIAPGDPVVAAFIDGWFPAAVAMGRERLDDYLCMLRLGGWDRARLRSMVLDLPDALLVDRLWRDWCEGMHWPSAWSTAFWPDGESAAGIYAAPDLLGRVEAMALWADVPEPLAERASAVHAVLERMQAA